MITLIRALSVALVIFSQLNAADFDACNLDVIYNDNFKYSLPRGILEGFLSGKAFDNREIYSEEEAARLHSDINELYSRFRENNPLLDKVCYVTAGAPGAGKTILLRQHKEINEKRLDQEIAYVDPDDVCLKTQYKSYLADLEKTAKTFDDKIAMYNLHRPGSNANCHINIAHLILEKMAFYYGTTASSPQTAIFFDFLKLQGYKIELLHVSASDEVRVASVKERDETFVQTTPKDVAEKGEMFCQRITDTYLKYADTIYFYHREAARKDVEPQQNNAVLAATWIRGQDTIGDLTVVDQGRLERIKKIHDDTVLRSGKNELLWELTVDSCSRNITQTAK